MRYLELTGTPFDRGREIGRACREDIQAIIAANLESLEALSVERTGRGLPKGALARLAGKCLPAAEAFSPELTAEMRGIADGAGCSIADVAGLNLFLDAYDLTFPALRAQLVDGCTTLAASPPATAGGEVLLGQNYDLRNFFRRGNLVLRIAQPGKPTALVYTIAGILGCSGLNSAGLGVVINNLTPCDSRPGVPYPLLLRAILERTRLGDAISVIGHCSRASGLNYLMADRDGEIVSVETSATRMAVLHGVDGYLGHSNHYTHAAITDVEAPIQEYNGDSYFRWGRANKALSAQAGRVTAEAFWDILRDHGNHPESICRHPRAARSDLMTGSTMASMVMDLRAQSVTITDGPPCVSPPVSYRLESGEPSSVNGQANVQVMGG